MAYLCYKGFADGIISEDSDLLVYLSIRKLNFPLLTKLSNEGFCIEYSSERVLNSKMQYDLSSDLFLAVRC